VVVQRDILILGAGHNALVAAFYLAKKGFRPLVLERRSVVGGAAITEEFHPGFRCSTLAHAGGPPLASIVEDMQLAKFGLERLESPVRLFAPSPDGRGLTLFTDPAASAKEIDKFSQKDAASYVELHDSLARLGEILSQLLSLTPPVVEDPSNEDLWKFLKLGRKVRRLGKKEMIRLIRWGPMAVADFVAEFFETDLLRAESSEPHSAPGPPAQQHSFFFAPPPIPIPSVILRFRAAAWVRLPARWPRLRNKRALKFAPAPMCRKFWLKMALSLASHSQAARRLPRRSSSRAPTPAVLSSVFSIRFTCRRVSL
jgi:phytoene dehydrogenase-like protein